MSTSETNSPINFEYNYRNTPHIILISCIFVFQYLTKRSDVIINLNEEHKKKGDRLSLKYLILFQFAKSCDWCLGPFLHEFFTSYHGFGVEDTAKMVAVSFGTSLFIGPSLIGYLNDGTNKKIPMVLYTIVLSLSCFLRLVKGNIFYIVSSQIAFGCASCILYTSFENWFVNEASKIKDQKIKDYVLASSFEKSMVGDAMVAVGVSFLAGYFKVS
jgi:predicted MFS family arabinose efflux permease